MTLLGKVISPGNGRINQGSAEPLANRYDSLMLWLDANDSSTLDQGFASGESWNTRQTQTLLDTGGIKAGKGMMQLPTVKLSSRRPTYQNTGFNSMPTLKIRWF